MASGVAIEPKISLNIVNPLSQSLPFSVNSRLPVLNNPFRFLLYTEWALLTITGITDILLPLLRPKHPPQAVVPTLLILALFGLMGLVLPSGKRHYKILYTGIEYGLIIIGGALGQLRLLPILYLIVVIRSCFIFELPSRRIVAGLAFIIYVIYQIQYTLYQVPDNHKLHENLYSRADERMWLHLVTSILLFGVVLLFVLQLVNTVLAERKIRQQLSLANQRLQKYAQQVEELATLEERNRIAREIHDSLGHSLTAMNIQLQGAMKLWEVNPDQAKTFLTEAHRLASLAMQEVRQSVRTLRMDAPQEESLEVAIQSLVHDFHKATGLLPTANFNLSGNFPRELNHAIYRIVQEALTNIFKYAEATKVKIDVISTEDYLYLTIEDNGRGFSLNKKPTGFGLQGMQERVAAFAGKFTIETALGYGCRINVEIPLDNLTA